MSRTNDEQREEATERSTQASFRQEKQPLTSQQRYSTLASQYMLFDVQIFNQWLNAYYHGDPRLASLYQKRFRAELRPAFEAWLATNPFDNPNALSGIGSEP